MKSWCSLLVRSSLLFAAAWCGTCQLCAPAAADASESHDTARRECCKVDRADDIWLISTRHLGCPAADKTNEIALHVEHYGEKESGWNETSFDEFLESSSPTQPTMIYIHGNRVDWNDAIRRAWYARNSVLGCSHIEPIRFVIWSWPSGQVHGQVRDVRVKAARTDGEARYLAWFLSQLDPGTPTSVLGYSFGARMATGALHLLGGGELAGHTLPLASSPRVRVVLLAAATHNHWLQPGACHEYALSRMDRLLIQYNSCDPVLQRYRIIEKHARPAALGYTGMYVDESLGVRIDQRDVGCIVGRSHAEARYFRSTTVTDQVRTTLFGE